MPGLRTLSATAALLLAASVTTPVLAKEKVKIEIKEWNLTTSTAQVETGTVYFYVKNKGEEAHEIAIIRLDTDVATGRLPVDIDGAVDEENMNFGELVGEMEDIEPGDRVKAEFRLRPGRYAVICNMVEEEPDGSIEAHYSMGMHALLEVVR